MLNIKKLNFIICVIGFVLCVISLFYFITFYKENLFLPAPFLMDRYDTFMDFYNVNWWANRGDFYSNWRGFYSPLSIFIANLNNDPLCVNSISSMRYRICNPYLYYPFGMLCTSISFIALLIYSRKNLISILITLVFLLSMPHLFAIERGNYIVLCLAILSISLFFNNKVANTYLYAILVNLKFYLIIPALLSLRTLKSKSYFLVLTFFIIIFFTHFSIDPKWYLIPSNILNFSGYIPSSLNVLWNTTTFSDFNLFFLEFGVDIILTSYIKFAIVFLKAYLAYRFYLFINYAYRCNIDCINIFYISILFLLAVSSSLNYYSIILLFPYFIYLNNLNKIQSKSLITIILLCIPNVFTLTAPTWLYRTFTPDDSLNGWHLTIINQGLSAASLTTPALILILFIQLTNYRNYETTK